jgi:hypothetical protein
MRDRRWRLATDSPAGREPLQRQTACPAVSGIDATDRQIDQLVYDLYGLTQEEIAIVDENNSD